MVSKRAEGRLESVMALAAGQCELVLGKICPPGDSGLQNKEMPVVFSSPPPAPLLGLMRLTLSPALLAHTSLPLPEMPPSPLPHVVLAHFCTC